MVENKKASVFFMTNLWIFFPKSQIINNTICVGRCPTPPQQVRTRIASDHQHKGHTHHVFFDKIEYTSLTNTINNDRTNRMSNLL